jgi:hypothetical protein
VNNLVQGRDIEDYLFGLLTRLGAGLSRASKRWCDTPVPRTRRPLKSQSLSKNISLLAISQATRVNLTHMTRARRAYECACMPPPRVSPPLRCPYRNATPRPNRGSKGTSPIARMHPFRRTFRDPQTAPFALPQTTPILITIRIPTCTGVFLGKNFFGLLVSCVVVCACCECLPV